MKNYFYVPIYGYKCEVYPYHKQIKGAEYDTTGVVAHTTIEFDKCKITFCFDFTKPFGTEVVAHECVHAATHIMLHRGCKADFENDEPLAYLVQYIMTCIMPIVLKQEKQYRKKESKNVQTKTLRTKRTSTPRSVKVSA